MTNFETFSFMFRGQMVTIDLSPFGAQRDPSLGMDHLADLAATTLNQIITLRAEVSRDHNMTRAACLRRFLASRDKDTGSNRTDFLRMQPEYVESKRARDWLDDALKAMLYGHYPRIRHLVEATRQGAQATGAVSRSSAVHGGHHYPGPMG